MEVMDLVRKYSKSILLFIIALFVMNSSCFASEAQIQDDLYKAYAIDMSQQEPLFFNLEEGVYDWVKSANTEIEYLIVSADDPTQEKIKNQLIEKAKCKFHDFINFKSIQEGLAIAEPMKTMEIRHALVCRVIFEEIYN